MNKYHPYYHALSAIVFLAILNITHTTQAHGFAGDYFFPATMIIDDPFVADEGSLPTFSTMKGSDGSRTYTYETDLSKSITPYFGLSAAVNMNTVTQPGQRPETGMDNLELSALYQAYTNPVHQYVISGELDASIGGTGNTRAGADSFSTWTPELNVGKGFGDLPDSLWFMQPLGITGICGVSLPSEAYSEGVGNPDSLVWGMAVEYNIIYLERFVKDMGIPAPFNRFIPLVEFQFNEPLDHGQAGLITGTINPGIIWSGKYCQFGIEAMVPINPRTGSDVGVIAQLHFYLDDIFPAIFKPIFGSN